MRLPATAVLIAALAVGCGQGVQSGSQRAPTPTPQPWTPTAPTSAPPTTAPPTTAQPRPVEPVKPGVVTIHVGDRGPQVLALQRRLASLGYWMGEPDGVFDDSTRHAVVALQKVAGIDRDGVVGLQTTAALRSALRPVPRTRVGDAIEVDLAHQVLLVVRDGSVAAILDTATGGGYTYVQDGGVYRATTPVGHFVIIRRIAGWTHSRLGWLWRPAYFFSGYAVHGYADVPPYPASHGCIRVTLAAMDWLWATGRTAPGMPVWVY